MRRLLALLVLSVSTALAAQVVVPVADGSPAARRTDWTLPVANAGFDYQIGGAFKPADDVEVVSRDRNASPAKGRYTICYVNAFQTQADERSFWKKHWSLVLKDGGKAVEDSGWGEWLLDTRTRAKRHALARIVGRWVTGCAIDGFDAVEYDNLDSWDRSHGLISKRDNKRYARLLTARAHTAGLAAGQKNWAELGSTGPRLGYDFAVAEECARWSECGSYAKPYADRVYDVEYRRKDFDKACRRWGDRISVVLRDLDVTPSGVDERC